MRGPLVVTIAAALLVPSGAAVRPADDLYRHANAEWLAHTAMPSDRVTYGTFAELADRTEADVKSIVDAVIARRSRPAGSTWQQIADLYLSATDETRIEALGAAPLQPELARIDAIRTAADLAAECGRLSAAGAGGPFAGAAGADGNSRDRTVVRITPGGTLLPSRAYYFDAAAPYADARTKYQAYLARILTAASRPSPEAAARDVLALERDIAALQWAEGAADSDQRFTLREIGSAMPGFDWLAWAKPQGIDRAAALVLSRPAFFAGFAALVPRVPIATWQNWLVARYVTAAAPFLSAPFDNARFDFFGSVLTGQELPRVRWKRGVTLVSAYLGDAVGRLYVERHFPPASRVKARRIVDGILDAYRTAIRDARWIGPAARRDAQARLSSLAAGVGYPDEWRDYSGLDIRRDDLFGNWLRALAFEGADRLRQSRSDAMRIWAQPPQTVNAAYSPSTNTVLVPAAVLQPPVFDPAADDADNYGAAGALVAHEVAHAFEGMLEGFDAGPLLAQLRALARSSGLHFDADLVARETAADVAGLSVAFRAYHASLKGRAAPVAGGASGDQRFFMAWAGMWRTVERDEYSRSLLATSPYLPPALRANLAAANVDSFYDAFAVQASDRMYVPPAQRARIW